MFERSGADGAVKDVFPFPSGVRSESMGSNPTRRLLMTTDLLTCLATIPDRRRAEGKMYGQAGVILFSILAMVSGARSYRQIHTLIDRRLGLLNAAFPGAALRRGGARRAPGGRAPAYTSVRGILQGLDEADLEQAFRRHAEGLDHTGAASPSRFVAIDGKTLRSSFDAFADRKAAHVLSAFAVDHRIILAHEVVGEKSNEIPAVQTPDRNARPDRPRLHHRRHALSKKHSRPPRRRAMTSSSRSRRTSRTCSITSKTLRQRQSPSRATTAVTAPATGRKTVLSRSSTQPARWATPNGPPSSRLSCASAAAP